ncbi:kinase-like protein [Trametes coccinea BRFM310]|uniref:Kinase-like protein n=1 Tax=Trametes coccinea (strain BRFM310) TaxID=1353009 RepID=A0A1Y2I8W6_TRAC3|nr:kinase-like protein [Trametes coccinea BRFM310]
MSAAPAKQKRLPHYVYLNDNNREIYTRSTLEGKYGLLPYEVFWMERQRFLHDRGYVLRPRYWPKWRPSWIGTDRHPTYCEDSIVLTNYQVLDARRSRNNDIVAIKMFRRDSQELQVSHYLSSLRDPQNHTVPILEYLEDPFDARLCLMVMPYLRPINDPEFSTVGEVIDFVNQTLEGLAFMHRHRIAHRDIAVPNIMVDAKALYPNGHHPVRIHYSSDAIYEIKPLSRAEHKLNYYYIDFGLAAHFPPGASSYVVGDVGRDTDVPELSSHVPYEAFAVDIFALGNLYAKQFEQRFNHTDFLLPLINMMKQRQPERRPSADEALAHWLRLRDSLNKSVYRWRLGPKSEPAIGRMFNDVVSVAWEGINNLKKFTK